MLRAERMASGIKASAAATAAQSPQPPAAMLRPRTTIRAAKASVAPQNSTPYSESGRRTNHSAIWTAYERAAEVTTKR